MRKGLPCVQHLPPSLGVGLLTRSVPPNLVPLCGSRSPRHGPAWGVSCGGLFSRRVRAAPPQRFSTTGRQAPLQLRVWLEFAVGCCHIGMQHYVEKGRTFVYSPHHDELWFLVEPRRQRRGTYHKWVCLKSGQEVWWYGVYHDCGRGRKRYRS